MLILSLLLIAGSHDLADTAKRGQTDLARTLLALGADPNVPDKTGIYPLDYAAFDNNTDLASLLLANHARVNLLAGGSAPLDFAVAGSKLETARLLIDNGADVRRVYPSGRTPLHIAALTGSTAVAGLLIDRGADIDARDKTGASPLDLAILKNEAETVNLLLDAGAKTHPGTLYGLLRSNRIAVVKVLLQHSNQPLGPLMKDALKQRRPDLVAVLVELGADPNARDESGFTALHDAALSGNLDSTRTLLANGADINAPDRDSGATPLYMAATMGRAEVVSLLLEKGADPAKGPSPLKAATAAGFDRVADLIRAAQSKPAKK